MSFFKKCKSGFQLVGGVLLSVMVLSSCNSEGGKESVQLSIGADSSASSSKWDKATIRSNYALIFRAEDYQAGLSLKEEFEKAKSVLRLDENYYTKLDFEDTSGDWIVQVRGYEEEDVTATESVRYGVHQTGISGSFQFRESGVTEVKVKIRPAGKHFPITGQLAHQRSTGSSCAFQLSMSGEQTANVGSRGYVADLEIYDGEGKKLGEMSQSAMQFDLMDYADKVKKLKVSLKVKTADPEKSEQLPMQEFQVNCDPFLIAELQTLQDSDSKTFALSPLLLKTQTPLVASQTPYDASHACSNQKGTLLVSKDNFSTCEPVDLTPTQDGQYLVIPKQSWNSNPVKYSLGVREKDDQTPTSFGLDQKTPLSFQAGIQNNPSSAKGFALAIAGVKADSELTLNSSGQYVYTPATANQCGAVKYQNKHDESFVASGNECQVSAALSGLVEDITFVGNSPPQISWKHKQGMSYNIYRKLSSSDSFATLATNASSPYSDTSVDANKTYNYRLEFCQGSACSAQTDSLTASARRFVQNPKATQSSSDTANLSWSLPVDVSVIKHYKIYRQKPDGSWELIHTTADASTTSWTDSGLTQAGVYQYRISAVSETGETYLTGVSLTLQTKPTAAPTGLAVVQVQGTETQAKLTWNAVTGATSYKIYRSTTSGTGYSQVHTINDGATTTYTNTGLTKGNTYYYKISAVNVAGESAKSVEKSVALIEKSAAPTGLAVVQVAGSETEAKLTWNATTGANSYKIYRSTASGTGYSQVHTTADGSTITYTDTVPTKGITYYYQISAVNIGGESAKSSETNVTLVEKSAAPTGLAVAQVANSETKSQLTWNATTSATSYKIYRSNTSGNVNTSVHTTADGSATTYTDTVPTKGRTYYYKISAVNVAGESSKSSEKSVALIEKPAKPTGLAVAQVQNSETKSQLTWNAVATANSYKVYRKTSGGAYSLAHTGTTTSYTDTVPTKGLTYFYKISAVNLWGESDTSTEKSITLTEKPDTPADLAVAQVTGSETQIKLTWSAVSDATSYKIYHGTTSGSVNNLVHTTLDGSVLSYTDTGLTSGSTNYYTISAVNIGGESAKSSETNVTLIEKPAIPTIASASKEALDSVKVVWNAASLASSYKLYQSHTTTASAFQIAATTTTATTYGQHDLPADSYYYRVKGCNSAGCSALSAASPAVQINSVWKEATNSADWSERYGHSSVLFNGKIWVLGGTDGGVVNDVWYSSDGSTWTEATDSAGWSARSSHSSVVFNGKIWVIGGYDGSNKNDVWSSSDGVNWTQSTASAGWSARSSHSSVVFNSKIWVLGGNDRVRKNDVWSSSDGVNWTQSTASAGWSARSSHSSVVFNGKMWVLGGNSRGGVNDVWHSSDGVNWTQSTASADWAARVSHQAVVFNGKMWVLGGAARGYKNDVWSSSDGSTWTESTASAGWAARLAHSSLVFNNRIWVLGGNDGGEVNDVWVDVSSLSAMSKMQDSAGKAYGRSVLKLDTEQTLVSQSTRGACSTTANTLLVSADGFVNCDAVFVKKGNGKNHVIIPKETWKLNATYQIGIMTSIGAKPLKDLAGNVLSFTTNNDTHDSTNAIKEFDVGGFTKLKGDDFHLDKDGKLWFYRKEGNTVPAYDANTCKNMFSYQNVNSHNFMPETTSGGGRTLAKDIIGGTSTYYLTANAGGDTMTRVVNINSGSSGTWSRRHYGSKTFYYLCGVEIPARS